MSVRVYEFIATICLLAEGWCLRWLYEMRRHPVISGSVAPQPTQATLSWRWTFPLLLLLLAGPAWLLAVVFIKGA